MGGDDDGAAGASCPFAGRDWIEAREHASAAEPQLAPLWPALADVLSTLALASSVRPYVRPSATPTPRAAGGPLCQAFGTGPLGYGQDLSLPTPWRLRLEKKKKINIVI